MMSPFDTLADYEQYIYTLQQRFPAIERSTVSFIRLGSTLARISGEIYFPNAYRIVIRERMVASPIAVTLASYGYEIWEHDQRLCWYDSQPHPDDATLQSTHPHHKHIHPDIKHNRIPAPRFSFISPNIQLLVEEITRLAGN